MRACVGCASISKRSVFTDSLPSCVRSCCSAMASKKKKDPNQGLYDIQCILSSKKVRGAVFYLIHWEGYDDEDNTWEPAATIEVTQAFVAWKELHPFGSREEAGGPGVQRKRRRAPAGDHSTAAGTTPWHTLGAAGSSVRSTSSESDESDAEPAKKRGRIKASHGASSHDHDSSAAVAGSQRSASNGSCTHLQLVEYYRDHRIPHSSSIEVKASLYVPPTEKEACELGVFATQAIAAGEPICWYAAHFVSEVDARKTSVAHRSHMRIVAGAGGVLRRRRTSDSRRTRRQTARQSSADRQLTSRRRTRRKLAGPSAV